MCGAVSREWREGTRGLGFERMVSLERETGERSGMGEEAG